MNGGKKRNFGRGRSKPGKNRSDESNRELIAEGIAVLKEFCRFRPEMVEGVFCTAKEETKVRAILSECGHSVPIKVCDEESLREIGYGDRNSPVKTKVKVNTWSEPNFLEVIEKTKPSLVLALDHITDPRNLGAIIRSAAFYGIPFVVAPERRQVQITNAALNTAQGGFALCDFVSVVNLGRTLTTLKKMGYWVVGTDMDGEPSAKVAGEYEQTVLVMGSEDTGMSRGIREKCDRLTALVPPGEPSETLDSLNVAVAAGILISQFQR